jgi:hypothetical protein
MAPLGFPSRKDSGSGFLLYSIEVSEALSVSLGVGSFNYAYIGVVPQDTSPCPATLRWNQAYDKSDLQHPSELVILTFEPTTLVHR